MNEESRKYWIVGASSGIGEALAKRLAADGHKVAVSARRAEVLADLRRELPGEGHLAVPVDVADAESVKATLAEILSQWSGLHSVIFMAGIYTPMRLGKLDLAETRRILEVNLLGAFHVVEAVLPPLLKQPQGQLALCSSVAGYRGMTRAQPYGATKAGLINFAESLRCEYGQNLDVRLIDPGFVSSRMTDRNDFPMPHKISAEQAAEHIVAGLRGTAFEIHFPKAFTRKLKLLRLLPYRWYFKIFGTRGA